MQLRLSTASLVLATGVEAGLPDFGRLASGILGLSNGWPGWGSDLPGGVRPALPAAISAAELLCEVAMHVSDVFGEPPAAAEAAWQTVLDTVPDGAHLLVDNMHKRAEIARAREASSVAEVLPDSAGAETEDERWETTAVDERFPNHRVRVTSPYELPIDWVKQRAGYLDIRGRDKHFFFWFFESRSNPEKDPVVLWLNGGAGCSSQLGQFFELGPSSIDSDISPEYNIHSWNNNANVIFLDQPVNVGYSVSDTYDISDTRTAARDTYAFLELFFQRFPEYAGLDVHIAGESYAGHYVPAIATEILRNEDRHFNLTSILIGNGVTDFLVQSHEFQPMACGKGGHPAVLSEDECSRMEARVPRCEALVKQCYDEQSAWLCDPAGIYCDNVNLTPFEATGLNVLDMRDKCEIDTEDCYLGIKNLVKYLNKPRVKSALGVSHVDEFVACNTTIANLFKADGDLAKPFQEDVAELLEANIPVLIYAGDKDYIANWLGNHAWTKQLKWAGQRQFNSKKMGTWRTRKHELAGEVRNFRHFTFLRVFDAGHMVPYDQPEAALDMLDRWLSGDYAFSSWHWD